MFEGSGEAIEHAVDKPRRGAVGPDEELSRKAGHDFVASRFDGSDRTAGNLGGGRAGAAGQRGFDFVFEEIVAELGRRAAGTDDEDVDAVAGPFGAERLA